MTEMPVTILRMNRRWGSCTLYLLACQVEVPWAIQVYVLAFFVCRALLLPFVCWSYNRSCQQQTYCHLGTAQNYQPADRPGEPCGITNWPLATLLLTDELCKSAPALISQLAGVLSLVDHHWQHQVWIQTRLLRQYTKHMEDGRWMWQGNASVVSWSWEKYSCQSKLSYLHLVFSWFPPYIRPVSF